jgi:hypothetical protein
MSGDGDARAKHWNDSARALLKGIILLTLTLAEKERNFIDHDFVDRSFVVGREAKCMGIRVRDLARLGERPFWPTEREKWASPAALSTPEPTKASRCVCQPAPPRW